MATNDGKNTGSQGGFADINGLKLHYEQFGTGEPLVLLGGGFMSIEAMAPVRGPLAASRRVIAVELQGHGQSSDSERPLSWELMADDIAALLQQLGVQRADIFGYSLGGGVALQTAIRHPEAVRRLVLVSSAYQRRGFYPEVLAGMAAMSGETVRIAPPAFVDKMRTLLSTEYDWTEGVAALRAPALIVVGDADSISPAHAVAFFGLLGGGKGDGAASGRPPSQLAILPDATHFTVLQHGTLQSIVAHFLDA